MKKVVYLYKTYKIYIMKKYLFSLTEDTEKMINYIIAKRALKNVAKPEKLAELLRNLIKEEHERLE